MRLLLDTHIFLWSLDGNPSMPKSAWPILEDEFNPLAVSVVSIWEIAIKYARRRGSPNDMPISGRHALAEAQAAGYELLPVSGLHAATVDRLPRHHGDPFDRLMIAQALTEPLLFLTHDKALAAYGDFVMVV